MGCSDVVSVVDEEPPRELILELYMNLPMTNDGYYIFDYPNENLTLIHLWNQSPVQWKESFGSLMIFV